MAQSKVTQFPAITNAGLNVGDSIMVAHPADGSSRKLAISELDNRYSLGTIPTRLTLAEASITQLLAGPALPGVAKGDLFVWDGAVVQRLPVGATSQLLVADPLQTLGMKWANSAGAGNKNYISTYNGNPGNGDFETGSTTGWSLFNTTLTSLVPTGGIAAGAASITTFAAATAAALQQSYGLNLTSSGVLSAGQGFISNAFTIDKQDQAKVLGFKFSYSAVLNTFNFSGTSANTWAVYIYDVTNSVWIQPAGVYNLAAASGFATGTFQTSSNGTQYRLAVVCINATSGASQIYFDDFSVGPQISAAAPGISEWKDYTPTFTGFGTATGIQCQWRRVGDTIELRGTFVSGTPTAVNATVGLPGGLVIGGSITNYRFIAGNWAFNNTTTGANFKTLGITGTSALNFAYTTSSDAGLDPKLGTNFSAAGVYISFNFAAPIVGWSSNSISSADTDTRVIAASALFNASSQTISTTQVAQFVNVFYDTAGAIQQGTAGAGPGATGWRYVAPVSGIYEISLYWLAPSALSNSVVIYKNGAASSRFFSGSTAGQSQQSTISVALSAGDYIQVARDAGSYSVDFGQIYIKRISGPATITATEAVYASYSSTATTSMTNGTNTSIAWTKIRDSHNTVNASNGIMTIPVSGTYSFSGAMTWTSLSTGGRYVRWSYNGGAYFAEGFVPGSNQTGGQASIGGRLVYCNAGDTLQMVGAQSSGGALSINGDPGDNWFSVLRVGN